MAVTEHPSLVPVPLGGRDVVCGRCGHLSYSHELNGCFEAILAGGGQAWSCPCLAFLPLDDPAPEDAA